MTTVLPKSINSVADACEFLKSLHDNGEAFHPEDDAADIVSKGGKLFTDSEAQIINALMDQVYMVVDEDFDPCAFLLGWDKIDTIRAAEKLLENYYNLTIQERREQEEAWQEKFSAFCDQKGIEESLDEWIARWRNNIHPVDYPNYESK